MRTALSILLAFMFTGSVLAQESESTKEKKNSLAFHLGPTFPLGDFLSKDLTNSDAGFAQTGITLDMSYQRSFDDNIGFAVNVFYNMNGLDIKKAEELYNVTGLKMDHWQFIGITVGPTFGYAPSTKTRMDIRLMGGVAKANSPEINFDGTLMIKEDWASSGVFQAGANVKTDLSSKVFFLGGLDYKYLKPTFDVVMGDGTVGEGVKQKMGVLNLTVGLGFKF
jgi:hypothetical protein